MGLNNYHKTLKIELNNGMCYSRRHLMVPGIFTSGLQVPLMFRCRNVSMHAFCRLFTTDLVANDCRVFEWLGALINK